MINGINTGIEPPAQIEAPQKKSFFDPFFEKLPPVVKNILQKVSQSKFYANKMIFWPVTISFSLIFIVLIAGLIFGAKGTPSVQTTFKMPSSTPVTEIKPTSSPSAGPLTDIHTNLNNIDSTISDLDLKQSRLQPPQVDYNVNF